MKKETYMWACSNVARIWGPLHDMKCREPSTTWITWFNSSYVVGPFLNNPQA